MYNNLHIDQSLHCSVVVKAIPVELPAISLHFATFPRPLARPTCCPSESLLSEVMAADEMVGAGEMEDFRVMCLLPNNVWSLSPQI